jgi:hypothetical protein
VMRDRGSAPVEFVLVGLVVTVLTLAVARLALDWHIRDELAGAAADGARAAARADATPTTGSSLATTEARALVGSGAPLTVVARRTLTQGLAENLVSITTVLPAVPGLASLTVTVEAHADQEVP